MISVVNVSFGTFVISHSDDVPNAVNVQTLDGDKVAVYNCYWWDKDSIIEHLEIDYFEKKLPAYVLE